MDVRRSRSIDDVSRVESAETPAAAAVRKALDTTGRLTPDGERCPTCQATLRRRYCDRCGARAPGELPASVGAFVRRAVERLLDADSRLLRSFAVLLARPGRLTEHHLRGNRTPYVGPVQLFAIVNVVIVLMGVTGTMGVFNTTLRFHVSASGFYHQEVAERWVHARIGAPDGWTYLDARALEDSLEAEGVLETEGSPETDSATGVSGNSDVRRSRLAPSTEASLDALASFRAYANRFNRQAQFLSRSLVFLLIPMLVVIFWLMDLGPTGPRARRGMLPHIIYATHVTTVWLLALPIAGILAGLGLSALLGADIVDVPTVQRLRDPVWTFLSCGAVAGYAVVSARRVYRLSWVDAALRGLILGHLLIPCLFVYRALLFLVGFTTT